MSNLILNQLIELFPAVSEEFLNGIYDAHKDEEVTIEELVDVIVSFEFPPPRENVSDHSLDTSNISFDGPINVESEVLEPEVPFITNSSNVDQPVEDEVLQKSAPMVNGDLSSEGKEPLLENSSGVKQSGGVESSGPNELSHVVQCENHKTVSDTSESDLSENSAMKSQRNEMSRPADDINNSTCSTNHEQFDEVSDDSSPESSIKYLMGEENFMERYNITTHLKELGEITEENREFAPDNIKHDNDSQLFVKNPKSNLVLSNGKSSRMKLKKGCQPRKKSSCSNTSQNGSFRGLPHSSTKRVTLRSCKVKNEEERLRRRLINQSRLFHERQEKNTNSTVCSSQFLNIDTKYSLLCKIFTDANPTYLLDQCELLTDQEKILLFISQNLEFRDYPKIETLKEEPKLMEEFHCTVPDFLEVIPDPVAEFSSANYVRAGYKENAEIYLKARYSGLSSEDVKGRLRASSYNLSAVCTQLEDEGRIPTPGVLDYTPLHHPASVFFHQEVWYIEHRKEVQDYMDSAIEAIRMQEELNRPPPPPDEVFECEICTDEIVEYIHLGTCDGPTGHLFCVNCIKRSVEVRIGDGETTFPCLVNCGSSIPLRTVEELLPTHVFGKLMGRIQEEEIRKANIAGVETCPFCPYAYGPGEETLFTCLNPDCMKLSCRICRKEDHSPDLCEMFKNEDEERARHIIENRMAEALMRTCYSCGKNFVKSGGCNKMVCNCGAKMCYVCRQPVEDYTHFNGQGGDNLERCPLFSQDDELHDRPVEATAQQVFNEIAANNPQLNLDRAKLIPQ